MAATARGTMLLNSVDFVRRQFGDVAHQQVLARLLPEHQAAFTTFLHEGSWKPLDALVAYMDTAHQLLAPGDPAFCRRMGAFAGRHDREHRAFRVMMSDLETATRMATILWRTYFDCGSLQVVSRTDGVIVVRIHDFPTSRALCERLLGSVEGQQSGLGASAEQVACVLDGAPACEIRVTFPTAPRS